jgi:hypothetical protein
MKEMEKACVGRVRRRSFKEVYVFAVAGCLAKPRDRTRRKSPDDLRIRPLFLSEYANNVSVQS